MAALDNSQTADAGGGPEWLRAVDSRLRLHTIVRLRWLAVLGQSLTVIFAGFANNIMKISFNTSEAAIRIQEVPSLVWPQYALLLTSLVLCFWMPDTLYQTIIHAVNAIGGGF